VALIDRVVAAALGGMVPLPSSDWASVELSDTLTASSPMLPMVEASPLPLPPPPCCDGDHADVWDLDDAAFRASFCTPPASPASFSTACAVAPSRRTPKKRPRRDDAAAAPPHGYATAQRLLRLQSSSDDDAPAVSPPYGLLGPSDSDEPF
jgi:hypothetical protein